MRRSSLRLLVVALALAGCGGSRPTAPLDATAQSYRAGEPGFVVEAVGTVRDGETGIDVSLGVPPSSLVFRAGTESLVAVGRWTVSVEGPGQPVRTLSPLDTLRAMSTAETRSPEPVWRTLRIPVPPGRYRVSVILEDRSSERTGQREIQAEVFGVTDRAGLGTIGLEGEGSRGLAPVDAASIPAGLDSLRAVVQAPAVPDGAQAVLSVVRLRSDSAPAPPPTAFTPAPGTLARRGVDPSQADTVQTVRQPLASAEVADLGVPLPDLGPGVYALRLDLVDADGNVLDPADRVVVVRRRDYPTLTRLGDLVAPLVYLGSAREVAAIEGASGAPQQAAFDRFWGERMDDRRLAAATVRAFYDRVEEANRQFATYKEGWKTDPGLVFILFGPPNYIEASIDGERWVYGQGGSAPAYVVFERTAGRAGETGLFSVLTLVRDRAYAEVWQRARTQWRSGIVP